MRADSFSGGYPPICFWKSIFTELYDFQLVSFTEDHHFAPDWRKFFLNTF